MLEEKDGLLCAALQGLEPLRYAPCRNVVVKVRDLWRSDPNFKQLDDAYVVQACDEVRKKLQPESGGP